MKKIKWLPVLAIFTMLMIVACSSEEEAEAPAPASTAAATTPAASTPTPAPAAATGSEPKSGGTLRYVVQGSIKYIDTMATGAIVTGTVGRHSYDQLFWRDKDYNIFPQMATDWNMSPDGLTYTFTVRDGITFHDGSALSMEDVMESHSRFARVDPLGRQLLAISPGNEGCLLYTSPSPRD